MATAVNFYLFAGLFVKDPILRHTTKSVPVCDFSIAINQHWKIAGKKCERTTFVDCVAWNRTAQNIFRWFGKGKAIFIRGELVNKNWTDKYGHKRTGIVVKVLEFQFVSGAGKMTKSGAVPDTDDETLLMTAIKELGAKSFPSPTERDIALYNLLNKHRMTVAPQEPEPGDLTDAELDELAENPPEL